MRPSVDTTPPAVIFADHSANSQHALASRDGGHFGDVTNDIMMMSDVEFQILQLKGEIVRCSLRNEDNGTTTRGNNKSNREIYQSHT